MKLLTILFAIWLCIVIDTACSAQPPVRFGIVGLVHDHARGFIPVANSRRDIQLVGIAEPNQQLAERYARTYKLDTNLFYTSLEDMLDKAKVQAVAVFTSTFDHQRIVET